MRCRFCCSTLCFKIASKGFFELRPQLGVFLHPDEFAVTRDINV